MPRVTKADLELHNNGLTVRVNRLSAENMELKEENEELKKRISRGHDRSRSPRMPAANSQANVETTCKALNQVKLWQRDAVVEEQRAEIQRLRDELAQKNDNIERLTRGEGPVGPVLVHAYRTSMEQFGLTPGPEILRDMSARTGPVYAHMQTLTDVLRNVEDFARHGRCFTRPTQLPY